MPKPFLRWRVLVAAPLLLGLASVYAQSDSSAEKPSEGSSKRPPITDGQAADAPSEPADAPEARPMTNRRLDGLLAEHFADFEVQGGDGAWRIELPGLEDNAAPPEEDGPAPAENGAPRNGQPQDPDEDPDHDQELDEQEAVPGVGERLPPVVLVLTDERANRMRIMIPIRPFDPNRVGDLRLALIALHANYDRALDARYAIKDGVLWSVFIHPLASLTPADLENALKQVITLRRNTGTTFSSSDLLFGGGRGGPDNQPKEPGDDVI